MGAGSARRDGDDDSLANVIVGEAPRAPLHGAVQPDHLPSSHPLCNVDFSRAFGLFHDSMFPIFFIFEEGLSHFLLSCRALGVRLRRRKPRC